MGVLKNIVGHVADRIQSRIDEGLEKLATRLDAPETNPPGTPGRWVPEAAEPLSAPDGTHSLCTAADLPALRAALTPRGRPLIIHHWATWCEPCQEELPRIERLYQALAGKADLVGVSWDLFDPSGPPAMVAGEVTRFANRAGVTWPTQLFTGTPETLFEGLELSFQHIPQTRVTDAAGRELRHFAGPIGEPDIEEVLALVK